MNHNELNIYLKQKFEVVYSSTYHMKQTNKDIYLQKLDFSLQLKKFTLMRHKYGNLFTIDGFQYHIQQQIPVLGESWEKDAHSISRFLSKCYHSDPISRKFKADNMELLDKLTMTGDIRTKAGMSADYVKYQISERPAILSKLVKNKKKKIEIIENSREFLEETQNQISTKNGCNLVTIIDNNLKNKKKKTNGVIENLVESEGGVNPFKIGTKLWLNWHTNNDLNQKNKINRKNIIDLTTSTSPNNDILGKTKKLVSTMEGKKNLYEVSGNLKRKSIENLVESGGDVDIPDLMPQSVSDAIPVLSDEKTPISPNILQAINSIIPNWLDNWDM
jgi:hypothetical protein